MFLKNSTMKSYKKALKISEYHDLKISSDPHDTFMMGLAGSYHAIHVLLDNAYVAWESQKNNQIGKTSNLVNLLTELSGTKIPAWDNQIQIIFNKKSDDYKSILPKFRKPFQGGGQLDRIKAVGALNNILTGYPALSAVKTDVDAFYTQLNTSYNNQKQNIDMTVNESTAVETAISNMADAQYKNLD